MDFNNTVASREGGGGWLINISRSNTGAKG